MIVFLNDWQKEGQFPTPREKKDERGVPVIGDGVEMVVDIKQVLVGRIALVEPGALVPCDVVYLAGASAIDKENEEIIGRLHYR